ncbi:hypothetical protein GCM10009677_48510 [Sphaerisporangium rubeum]|uniref:EfeO-type cupredoxin-like domain-containing protein n=1 Tax=Sphaerisporangium rubeum TaxID=321317 RepID=A0A7X0I933_9ACTN|nr:hypothetical protein [Sphaerisporangium rubeum]MBB6470887.1 hypothetical protein [Sphaerisporangium rubeum]
MNHPRRSAAATLAMLALTLLLAVTACGGGTPAPAATGPVKEMVITIAGGAVSPPFTRVEVTRGQAMRITVTSDVADQAHVHGFDKRLDLTPGVAGTIEFVADAPGIYEVEVHKQELPLFQLLVR